MRCNDSARQMNSKPGSSIVDCGIRVRCAVAVILLILLSAYHFYEDQLEIYDSTEIQSIGDRISMAFDLFSSRKQPATFEIDGSHFNVYEEESGISVMPKAPANPQHGRRLVTKEWKAKKMKSIVTLVIQSSEERFWMLSHICRRWEGPMSFVGYFATSNLNSLKRVQRDCQRAILTPYIKKSDAEVYPINTLRNMAIAAVRTPYYLLIDIDFWPDGNLHKNINYFARGVSALGIENRTAIVVPAFRSIDLNETCHWAEHCPEVFEASIPLDFYQLTQCVTHNYCRIFDWIHNIHGHSTTDYPKWFTQNKTDLRRVTCFRSDRYEPYLVLKKTDTVKLYDERFTGYGKNKIQFIMNLRYSDFRFYVIPRSFVTHVPHRPSKVRKNFEKHDSHRDEMNRLIDKYETRLREAKNLNTRLCSDRTIRSLVTKYAPSYPDMWVSSISSARKIGLKLRHALKPVERFIYEKNIPRPPCASVGTKKPPECY